MKKLTIILFLCILGTSYSFSQSMTFKMDLKRISTAQDPGKWIPFKTTIIYNFEEKTILIGLNDLYKLGKERKIEYNLDNRVQYAATNRWGEYFNIIIIPGFNDDTYTIYILQEHVTTGYMGQRVN